MKRILLLAIVIFITCDLYAYTERNMLQRRTTPEELKTLLMMNQEWVPYPEYKDREGWDKFLGDRKVSVIKRGESKLNYQWQVVKATDYLEFERSGNRRAMQDPYEANFGAIADLLLAELAEGEGRFIDQLINGVYFSCEMTSWVLSAHLVSQRSRRPLPHYQEQYIDIISGDISSLLSWVYYFFREEFDKVHPVIAQRLREELQKRTLDPYMEEDRFWWMGFNLKPGQIVNNWNVWCNFNMLQCFLLLENDRDKLAEAVYKTMRSVDQFLNFVKSDGACEEGPHYWGQAAGRLYDYLQVLYDGTGGKISIFEEPMIKRMGEYIVYSYVGDGWVVNFADASAKWNGDGLLVYRYGKSVNSPAMMQFGSYLYRRNHRLVHGTAIFRTFQSFLHREDIEKTPPACPQPGHIWYPETEFCYMTDGADLFLATKGGFNNESHNHNDVGTFSLYVNRIPVFIDAGVGTYTRQTFSHERYSLWSMQSNYHNVPLINGQPQATGEQFRAKNSRCDAAKNIFTTDIAAAYPENSGVKKWIREYDLNEGSLQIKDQFSIDRPSVKNQINFLTWGDVDIDTPGKVMINVMGEQVILSYNPKIFDAIKETIILEDPSFSSVWGEKVYRITLQAKRLQKNGEYIFEISKK